MLKISNFEVMGWEHAIRGMRNPMNSWEKSDSGYGCHLTKGRDQIDWTRHKEGEECRCTNCDWCSPLCEDDFDSEYSKHVREFIIAPNDLNLMTRLRNAGTDHRKFMRMIAVYVDLTAPLYWWKEFDTYKVGTVTNSCSTMHKITAKEFTLEDFSCEHLTEQSRIVFFQIIETLNMYRALYIAKNDKQVDMYSVMTDECYAKYKKDIWWQMIQLLPSSYNQRRTVMLNYEVLANIHKSRRNHKLDEWHTFCNWIEELPYSELITGYEGNEK